jgi:shikimate dehydrogenase
MFAEQFGKRIDYQAIETNAEDFSGHLQQLVAQGALGCNVTVPLKFQAWQLAQRASRSAQRAQAVNTLVFEHADDWFGDSTDGRGLVRDIRVNLDRKMGGARICIIGAGGAAAGILGDLLDHEPKDIVVANRSFERAQKLAGNFGSAVTCQALGEVGEGAPFDLVINATSSGHSGQWPELPHVMFHSESLCYDLNYGSAAEPLRVFCDDGNIQYQDGLGMLVEQAALSFTLWTGLKPDTAPVLRALKHR